MKFKENIKKYAPDFLRVIIVSILVGVACGIIGAVFVKSISFVTGLRENNPWILYLLPAFGLLIAFMYNALKVNGVGTNSIIRSVRTEEKTSPFLGIAIFLGTALSHLGGASVGREGAALQLGGSVSGLFARIFKIPENYRRILVMSGMGACFSALFGTPLAAFVFILEVARVGKKCFTAVVPVFLSSVTAFLIANKSGVEPERFPLNEIPAFSLETSWKFILISVAGAVVSMLFVLALHHSEKVLEKIIKNVYIRIAVGGAVIILLTKLLGTTDYNGGGIGVVHHIFTHGEVNYEAFILKIIFTAISIGAGYKGGEIVPTIFIGGTLGGMISCLVGLNPAFGAAIGIVALFSGATNAPLATVVLACEMFGFNGIAYYLVASAISFALSGKTSLYEGRKIPFAENK